MLITTKTLVDHAAEGLPIMRKVALDGLEPTSSSAGEVVGGNSNPNLWGN
jgi:hypothetical protein